LAPPRFGAWPSFSGILREWIRAEAGAGRLLPWVPVAFGTGIALYFTADHEPVLPVAAVTAVLLCASAFLLRRQRAFPVAVMIAAIAAGFATATTKTALIAHGVLARGFADPRCKTNRSTREPDEPRVIRKKRLRALGPYRLSRRRSASSASARRRSAIRSQASMKGKL
jgi:alpha-beta hydrolase superfamily lysophospholipase